MDPCPDCRGGGKTRIEKTISVKIPPGVENGSQMRIRGEGEAGEHGGPSGDLFVVIHVKEHNFYRRDGENLACRIPVSFVQAALGARLPIPVLGDEKEFELDIPAGTQPGQVIRIQGMGMPALRGMRKRGDLYVEIIVKIPEKLSQRQTEILREFADTENLPTTSKKKRGKGFWKKITDNA